MKHYEELIKTINEQLNKKEDERAERTKEVAQKLISYCGRALYERKCGYLDMITLEMINDCSEYLLKNVIFDEEEHV